MNDEQRLEADILGKQMAHNEEMITRWERELETIKSLLEHLYDKKRDLEVKQRQLLGAR